MKWLLEMELSLIQIVTREDLGTEVYASLHEKLLLSIPFRCLRNVYERSSLVQSLYILEVTLRLKKTLLHVQS